MGWPAWLGRTFAWLSGDLHPDDMSDQELARQAYADYLQVQLSGFSSKDVEKLKEEVAALKAAPSAALSGSMGFAELMGVETRLASAMADEDVERGYWLVRERFERVGSTKAVAVHSQWAPLELREPSPIADLSPLAAAIRAEAVALTEAGRAAVHAAAEEAAARARADPLNPQEAISLEAARKAAADAIATASEATSRRKALEAAQGEPSQSRERSSY